MTPIQVLRLCRNITASLCALALAACASVRIESGPDQVRVEQRWGVLAISVDSPANAYVAKVESLGLLNTPFGWSAGFSRQSWAALGPECRLVIWVSQPEHLETARRLADPKAGICIAAPQQPTTGEKHHETQPESPDALPGTRP